MSQMSKMPKMPNMERTLTLSTAHLRESTGNWLAIQATFAVDEHYLPEPVSIRFAVHAYGYIFFISADTPLDKESFESIHMPELYRILRLALTLGCSYVNFDRDVSEDDQFPTFKW
jgi:hypothetical protein